MNFDDIDESGWAKLARSFLLRHKSDHKLGKLILVNPKIESFVRQVHDSKIEAERKICRRFDRMILHMRESKLKSIVTKEFGTKIRSYIKLK